MLTRYLDPKNDLAFKKIFGSEKHKGIPMDFLNAALCLEGEDRIVELEFLNIATHSEIKEAYQVLDRFTWSEEEIQGYEKIIMNIADSQGMLDAAREEGELEGIRKVAQGMLNHSLSIEDVAGITGLSKEEVRSLHVVSKK